jgi:uncharacterized protein
MRQTVKKILILLAGWAFLLLGVVGLFLPILQGILFLIIGLLILSSEYVWAHRLLSKLSERFPKIRWAAESASIRTMSWLRRIWGASNFD